MDKQHNYGKAWNIGKLVCKWERRRYDYGNRNAQDVNYGMKREDAPNVVPALKEKVTNKDAEKDNVQKLSLEEVLNPT